MEENSVTLAAARRIQLETLQTRITVHGNRMWQLPFTYVSFAAIAASLVTSEKVFVDQGIFFYLLSAAGVLVLWAMIDAYKSYSRTARAMNSVELNLHLEQYTTASFSHAAPHFALCISAIISLAVAGFYS